MSLASNQDIAQRLAKCKEQILTLWGERVKEALPSEQNRAQTPLRDDLPRFFDELVSALLNEKPVVQKLMKSGAKHGEDRAETERYSLGDLLVEYRIFRGVLFEVMSGSGPIGESARKLISESIDFAVEASVCTFVNYRQEIEQRREREFNDTNERFRAIFDQAASGIMLVGLDGKWIDANQKLCDMLGYSLPELRRYNFREITYFDDVDRSQRNMDRLLNNEVKTYSIEKRYLRKDGKTIWISGVVSLVRDHTGLPKYFLAVIIDIDRRKELEVQLVEAKDAAESANRLKTAFLANVSHEIRTPLGAILGFTDLLKSSALSASERSEYLEIIERNGKALTRVIDDVLDLSKVEAGRLEIEPLLFSLPDLIDEVISLFRDQARNKGIVLKLEAHENLPVYVISDPTRLRQILINILGNAVKFTARGDVRVFCLGSAESEHASKIEIFIRDTGTGLSAEQVERLFQPFNQADNSTSRRFGGTGLGLTLSRRLARMLGGDVRVEDFALGEGCTFVISFRAQIGFAPKAEGLSKNTKNGSPRLDGIKVLVVEDSADNRFLVRTCLVQLGAQVDEANDGKGGVQMALRGVYDVVLMDIQMPGLDGYQATAELRRTGYSRPILALTAHAMKEEFKRSIAAGFDDHLTKPLDAGLLAKKVAHFARIDLKS